MYIYTHFLVGILIQKLLFHFFPPTLFIWVIVCILSFLSHWVVDLFSYITFHPDETHSERFPEDRFKLFVDIMSVPITAFTLIYFTFFSQLNFQFFSGFFSPECYIFSMISAWFADVIDWEIVRRLAKHQIISKEYYSLGILHKSINKFRETIFPWFPNWREKKWAFSIDLGITCLLLLSVYTI
jgi:hypothetical protein